MSIKNILFDLKHYEDDTKIKKIIKILNLKCKAYDKFDSGESYNFNRALARETS